MANVTKKQFQDYTLEERQLIWTTLREALDEAGHDEMQHEIVNQLPEDEKEYMAREQFNGIAFDPDDFKDTAVIEIINGNNIDAGESIDFDAILSQAKDNQKVIPDLEDTPMEKAQEEREIAEILNRVKKTGVQRFERDEKYIEGLLKSKLGKTMSLHEESLSALAGVRKAEKKIPIDDDDTVEIEEMDGEKYVEIEPEEEHAEEVATGYEKESDDLNTEDNITHPDTSKPKESKKSKVKKAFIDFKEGMTLKEFFERNKASGGNTIMGFDLYSVNLDGKQVATNYTGVEPSYADYIVDSYQWDDFLGLLDINIRKSKVKKDDNLDEQLEALEQELWRSPTSRVDWDKLKEYDTLYNQFHGSHFISNPELIDNMEARDIVDQYCGYLAWNNHGNEAHWMEYPETIFEVYTDPKKYLDYMEDQGDLEYYDSDEHVRAIVDALRNVKKGCGKMETKKAEELTVKAESKTEKSEKQLNLSPQQAIRKCADYQAQNKLMGLMDYEIKELTGYDADRLLGHMAGRQRVRKTHCADGTMCSFRM